MITDGGVGCERGRPQGAAGRGDAGFPFWLGPMPASRRRCVHGRAEPGESSRATAFGRSLGGVTATSACRAVGCDRGEPLPAEARPQSQRARSTDCRGDLATGLGHPSRSAEQNHAVQSGSEAARAGLGLAGEPGAPSSSPAGRHVPAGASRSSPDAFRFLCITLFYFFFTALIIISASLRLPRLNRSLVGPGEGLALLG